MSPEGTTFTPHFCPGIRFYQEQIIVAFPGCEIVIFPADLNPPNNIDSWVHILSMLPTDLNYPESYSLFGLEKQFLKCVF